MKNIVLLLLVVVLAGVAPVVVRGQKVIALSGTVRDGQGRPVAAASVQLLGRRAGVSADSLGNFRIRVRPGESICVNSIGYRGDTVRIGDTATRLAIVLQPRISSLEGIVVTGADPRAIGNDPMHTVVTRSAGAMLEDFLRNEEIYSGQTLVTPYSRTAHGYVRDASQAYVTGIPGNTFYRMSAIPSFSIKEDVKGNRYLLGDRWGQGVVVTTSDSVVDNRELKFNFDKIQQKLYATKDLSTVIELDNQNIRAFAIKDGDSLMIFDRVAAIDSSRYFLAIVPAVGGKYSLYRDIRTRLVKSDYHSDGLTESGTPYDEYVDNNSYFLVMPQGLRARRLEMRKKYLKEIIPEEKARVDVFFSKHRFDLINEVLLKEFILSLNDQPQALLTFY